MKSSHPFATSSDTSETADRFKFSANEVFSDAEMDKMEKGEGSSLNEEAPRAPVTKVKSCLKQREKSAQKRKFKCDKKTQLSDRDGSIYSNDEEMGEEEREKNIVNVGQTSKKSSTQSDKRVPLERARNSTDSDEEYDHLTSRIWKDYEDRRAHNVNNQKAHHTKRIRKGHRDAYVNREEAKSKDANDEESASEEKNAHSGKGYRDLPWHTMKTKDMACTFNEPANDAITVEIADELSHVYEEEDSSYNQAFQVIGYRTTKMAQQYKSQVQSVIRRLKLTKTATKPADPKPPVMYLLLLPGKDGVKLLKTWLSYAVEKYQPGTVRSYLMSF
ncbi:hypothetical protein pdam_00010415 [Pocillopora damicornis]|uniref:Uncharacterized protein n=1 Tax=Pocillopora damicornis TaxID=46731 RepID=A0A3M6UR85_POCDA|nr:hypothetical protein pdam_00010415 [Pocillopora damicornis]